MELPAETEFPAQTRWLTRGRVAFWSWRVVLLLIAVAALYGGVMLREKLYRNSDPFRFHGDIANGWNQGTGIYKDASVIAFARLNGGATTRPNVRTDIQFRDYFTALRGRYDTLFSQTQNDDYGLDYPPARLLIMSSWVWYSRTHTAGRPPEPWNADLAASLLRLNTIMEALSAVAIFLIIRRVLLLDESRSAATTALIGSLLAWFALPALLDGHVWPQWDNWPLPFYLWACWLALRNNWLAAGALLAIGAMCKGQMLMAAPALALWPLFGFRLRATLDLLLGFFFAAMVFVSPWFLNTDDSVSIFWRLALCTGWPVLIHRNFSFRLLFTAIALTLLFVGLRCGSVAWYFIGFAYGARHFQAALHIGAIPNLASIIQNNLHLNAANVAVQQTHLVLTVRQLLVSLNVIATILCGVALALQQRRGDRRILAALMLPWLAAVSLMPQMHERYMLWAGVCSALLVGLSVGGGLLHLLISLIAALPIATALLDQTDRSKLSPDAIATVNSWQATLHGIFPGTAWSMFTLMLVVLYLALTPSRTPARLTYATPVQT